MFRIFILFIFIFHTAFAKQPQFGFVGLIGSYDTVSLDSDVQMGDADETTFGLRFGKQTQDYRTVFTLSGNDTYQSIAVEADIFLVDDMFGVPEVRPYLGATLGYMYYDDDTLNTYTQSIAGDTNSTSSSKNDGAYYGINFGFVFYATDTVDLDLSYHYYIVDSIDPLDAMHGVSFALHYFY